MRCLGGSLADFAALWMLIHATRFGPPDTPLNTCILERWRDAGQKAGVAARERLRDGVQAALAHIGDGLLPLAQLYASGYSLARLRDRTVRPPSGGSHDDLWDGLCITFAALARGEPLLGLPALDGLFACSATPDLDSATLPNAALLGAVFGLAWLQGDGAPVPVNWRDMETEELGSVYESLLELTPRLGDDGHGFALVAGAETRGN